MNLGDRLKQVRKAAGLTQDELATRMGVLATTVSNYEKNRSQPNPDMLILLSKYLGVSIDYLLGLTEQKDVPLNVPLNVPQSEKEQNQTVIKPDVIELEEDYITGKRLRVLPIVVDRSGKENIPLVTTKAAAGYLEHLEEPEYFGNLPTFSMPMPEFRNGTFRCFPVQGESMAPGLMPGNYVWGRYVQNWPGEIKDGKVYIIAYNGSVRPVIKRVKNRLKEYGKLALISDNPEYATYTVDAEDIREVWLYVAHLRFTLHQTKDQLQQDVLDLKSELALLRERIDQIDQDKSDVRL